MIYLHIGRNKAGSTSIQDYFARHHAAMQARGVEYVLFGHMQGSVPGVAGFSSTGELAAYARRNPDLDLFLSNEFMAAAPQGFIDEAAANFKGLDVTLMAYIRDYNSWLVSGYGFDIRAGWNARDFDAYLKLHPGDADLLHEKGDAYRLAGDALLALQYLDAAIAADQTLALAWWRRSIVKTTLGDAAGAAVDKARALKLDPHVGD